MMPPKCPKCGSEMKLREAKQGKNAGNKFYGCSRYPECNGTLPYIPENNYEFNLDENEKTEFSIFKKSDKNDCDRDNTEIAKKLFCRPRFKNFQVKILENAALTLKIFEKIYFEENNEDLSLFFSQWRLDFPMNIKEDSFTEKESQIISVLEKILTRGRITLTSPWIENKFESIYNINKSSATSSLIKSSYSIGFEKKKNKIWLDTEEENIFYDNILPQFFNNTYSNYQQFVIPKVNVIDLIPDNLVSDSLKNQKLDFVIFHPDLDKSIIVQIEEHYEDIESYIEIDEIMHKFNYNIIHIPSKEIIEKSGPNLSALNSMLSNIKKSTSPNKDNNQIEIVKYVYIFKIIHQIQITLLSAIQSGYLKIIDNAKWFIYSDINNIGLYDDKQSLEILSSSVSDFIELLKRLCKIYSYELNLNEPVCCLVENTQINDNSDQIFISFSDKFSIDIPTFYVQNLYLPFHIQKSSFSSPPLTKAIEKQEEKDLEYFLQYIFRKPFFFEGQYEAITRLMQSKDTILLLPTGAGKSLVYQLASLLLPGITMVIDPIISLMEDQIDNLGMIGIDSCITISSKIKDVQTKTDIIKLMGQGEYFFVFISPERFQTVEFRESLKVLTVNTPVSLIVIDEAHCVSEWGHDFRTAYLNIGRNSREFCKYYNFTPPLIGLSGTASRSVLKDIQRELRIDDFDAIITPKSFDRKELKFHVIKSHSKDKSLRLKGILSKKLPNLFNTSASTFYEPIDKNTFSGLIFCPHVNGEFGIQNVSNFIKQELKIPLDIYSGKEPKHEDKNNWNDKKTKVTKNFKRNKIPLLVCTKAFGMGIDKPNIRYTIHYGIPPSIESFYQESGRAGRDKKTAHCYIIVSNDDPQRTEKLLNPNTSIEEINKIKKSLSKEDEDDITRILYFHTNSFSGIENEKNEVKDILNKITEPYKKQEKTIDFSPNIKDDTTKSEIRQRKEKAIHRLLTIGVISDYTINYFQNTFSLMLTGATKEEIIHSYGKYISTYLSSRKQVEIDKAIRFLNLEYQDFVIKVVELLLHFIYEVIEKGRRRAIQEMLLACSEVYSQNDTTDEMNDKFIRSRILRYLEATQFSEIIENIIDDEKAGLLKSKEILDIVTSQNDAAELRGQVIRYLESYPDHPALLMLRSISEIFCKDKNIEIVKQNYLASISSSKTKYNLSDDIIFDYAAWGIAKINKRDNNCAKELINKLVNNMSPVLIRLFLSKLDYELAAIPAWYLLNRLSQSCEFLILKRGE